MSQSLRRVFVCLNIIINSQIFVYLMCFNPLQWYSNCPNFGQWEPQEAGSTRAYQLPCLYNKMPQSHLVYILLHTQNQPFFQRSQVPFTEKEHSEATIRVLECSMLLGCHHFQVFQWIKLGNFYILERIKLSSFSTFRYHSIF